jgi:iron complex transport system substrate-binding protein
MKPPVVLVLLLAAALGAQQPVARPSRIICFIPAVTEMLYAIGAGEQVAAVGSFDRYPPAVAKLPRVGALLDPNLERILSLRPDLVIVYGSQTDLRQQLERAGIPIFLYSHAGLADVTQTMSELGGRVGRAPEAERAAVALNGAIDRVRERTKGRARPRVLVVFGREAGALRGIYASGGVGFIHDMLEVAGGANVFADVKKQSVQATTELILARQPDVIVELRGSDVTPADARSMREEWNAVSAVPAVRAGRLHIITDERTVIPGPRVAEGARLLAEALHPDVFK